MVLLAGAAGGLAAASPALAGIVPCSTASLVAAISAANSTNGTVTLTSGCVYTLTAANNSADGGSGLPVITGQVTVAGGGATITRSAAGGTGAFRIFDVASAGKLTLSSVTLSNGLASNGAQGGGAIFSHGTLSVSGSTFSGNSSPAATGTSGGAIDSSGTLTVNTSAFTGNTAQEGGGVFNQKTATITNSTFTRNTATIYGGGALLNAAGTETVTGDTFTGNTGPGGGAIDNDTALNITDSTFYNNTAGGNGGGAVQNFGTTTIRQSTLAGNTSPYGADILNYTGFTLSIGMSIVSGGLNGSNCGGQAPITDAGYNIDSGTSCGFSAGQHSMSSTQPQLDALAANGGPTQTMALPARQPGGERHPRRHLRLRGQHRPARHLPAAGQRLRHRRLRDHRHLGRHPAADRADRPDGHIRHRELGLTAVERLDRQRRRDRLHDLPQRDRGGRHRRGDQLHRHDRRAVQRVQVHGGRLRRQRQPLGAVRGGLGQYAGPVRDPGRPGRRRRHGQPGDQHHDHAAGPGARGRPAGRLVRPVRLAGQVQVSDNVNGPWTRGTASTTFSNGGGDIALYYLQDSAAAPSGLTITISASNPTYLEAALADYSGAATTGALDQTAMAKGNGTSVDSGPTAAVGAGELVVGGIITGGSPGSITAGSSQGQPFAIRSQTSSGSVDVEDVLASAAGAQDARATFGTATDWYAVAAVFHPASG